MHCALYIILCEAATSRQHSLRVGFRKAFRVQLSFGKLVRVIAREARASTSCATHTSAQAISQPSQEKPEIFQIHPTPWLRSCRCSHARFPAFEDKGSRSKLLLRRL